MRIPTGNFGNVTPTAQATRIDVGNTGAQEQALVRLATVGIGVAQDQQQRIDQENQSQLQAITLQLDDYSNTLVNDPDHGLLAQQGTNAEGVTNKYLTQYQDYANKLAAEVPEPLRQQYEVQAKAKGIQLARTGLTFETSQRRQVEEGNFNSTVSNSQTRAEAYWDDNVSYQLEVGSTRELIAEYGKAHGWTEEQIAEKQTAFLKTTAFNTAQNIAVSRPDEFVRMAGEPSDVGGATRYSGGTSADPVGLRNNNPGNLVRTENTWDGEVKGDGRFASFATPEHGLRALCKNLLAYNKRGYTTVGQIINRWAPPEENDTAAYTAAVSKALGVPADKPLDLTDINTLTALCASITQHENGSNPYTKEQITTGAMAALGVASLPQPEGAQLRSPGKTTAATQLDPVQLARLRSMAQGQLSQQQAQYAQQLGTSVKDAYAALDEGLQPQSIPSQNDFMRAYGPVKGQQQWQDMQQQQIYGSVIAAAKDMSPAARQDLLERLRPTDPVAGNFAATQQRWERMQTKFKQLDAEWEKDQGRVMVSNALTHGVALDPASKSNKAAADSYYDNNFSNFNINNNDDVNAVTSFVTKIGVIPTRLSSVLNAASSVKDPAVAVPAAELVSRIYDSNPAALSGMPKERQSFFLNAKRLRDAGVNADKAVEQAYDLAYNQTDAMKAQLASEQGSSSYRKDRLSAASEFVSERSQFFRVDPSAKDTNAEAARFRQDFESLYDINFRISGGDAEIAKKMTSQQISRTWSISEVNGSAQLMKYAPEALYQGGPSGWQSKQWEKEKNILMYGTVDIPSTPVSTAAGGSLKRATGNISVMPERKVKGDLILVPDVSTPRNGDYAIMISDKDKDGVPTLQPYYDAGGRPMRYRPDLQSWQPYQQMLADDKANVEQTMMKAQERRAFSDVHRSLDQQYQQGHEQRIEKQKEQLKNYFQFPWNKN